VTGGHQQREPASEAGSVFVERELRRGLELARGGEHFAAHEAFEAAWRAAEPVDRDFFQGLVHVVVAWYQAARGNRKGCASQLDKAARRLAPFAPAHRGVDVAMALDQVRVATRLVASGSLDLPELRV
jgi:predicted metal-dependent hydrolase